MSASALVPSGDELERPDGDPYPHDPEPVETPGRVGLQRPRASNGDDDADDGADADDYGAGDDDDSSADGGDDDDYGGGESSE